MNLPSLRWIRKRITPESMLFGKKIYSETKAFEEYRLLQKIGTDRKTQQYNFNLARRFSIAKWTLKAPIDNFMIQGCGICFYNGHGLGCPLCRQARFSCGDIDKSTKRDLRKRMLKALRGLKFSERWMR